MKKREEGISRYIKHKRKIEFILPRRAAQTPYKKKEKCRYINHVILTRAHFWISQKKYSGPKHIYNWLTISNWVKGIKNIYYFRNLLCVTICAVKKKIRKINKKKKIIKRQWVIQYLESSYWEHVKQALSLPVVTICQALLAKNVKIRL